MAVCVYVCLFVSITSWRQRLCLSLSQNGTFVKSMCHFTNVGTQSVTTSLSKICLPGCFSAMHASQSVWPKPLKELIQACFCCSIHVASVVQMTHLLLQQGGVAKVMTDNQICATYYAALIHDFEHLGVNNDYLIKSFHPLAVMYNDISPLENHHVAAAVRVMLRPECMFCQVSPARPVPVIPLFSMFFFYFFCRFLFFSPPFSKRHFFHFQPFAHHVSPPRVRAVQA